MADYNKELQEYVENMGRRSKEVAPIIGGLSTDMKNAALNAMAAALRQKTPDILAANAKDLQAGEAKGLTKALLDRLMLNEARIEGMAAGLEDLIKLPDPIGETIEMNRRPNGLEIGKRRVPLGVVAIIYEARPNVTADAAGLALKTGNALILKGGSEALESNKCVTNVLRRALKDMGIPEDGIQLVETADREAVACLLQLRSCIDVVIPRGGAGLIQFVVKNSAIPAIETWVGNCHVFIDKYADLNMGAEIVFNAKTQRPAVCNAMESLLVHKDVAVDFFPLLAAKLKDQPVEIRGCKRTCSLWPEAVPAKDEDWDTEYLDLIMSVAIVDDLDSAIEHIRKHGTGHSEAIITENYTNARAFLDRVDAAAVYVNASTRFTDGNEFGYGAEIGISTQKLHARGPMGLNALTSEKYIIYGNGQIRG
ncbi:MAG: glutamate-5-semialdehyde dehydrogenase [Bacillota bacterium]|nr:glutamate-5-semialdehyde dehydrogenase [Bacillota bacterium]